MSTSSWLTNTCTISVWPPLAAHIRGVRLSCRAHRAHNICTTDKQWHTTIPIADNGPWNIHRHLNSSPIHSMCGIWHKITRTCPTSDSHYCHTMCLFTFRYLVHWQCCVLAPPPKILLLYLTFIWWLILAPPSSNMITISLWPLSDDIISGVSPPSYIWQREKTWLYISSHAQYEGITICVCIEEVGHNHMHANHGRMQLTRRGLHSQERTSSGHCLVNPRRACAGGLL